MSAEFTAERILSGLKEFQRATVDHAVERLYEAEDSSRRFLVADEVGLGKTLVARGVTARAIERLQRAGVERVDVVYVCSNAEIAQQRWFDQSGVFVQHMNVRNANICTVVERLEIGMIVWRPAAAAVGGSRVRHAGRLSVSVVRPHRWVSLGGADVLAEN